MKAYFGYWGKLDKTKEALSFHPLAYHSLDVAAVAYCFLEHRRSFTHDIADFLGLDADTFTRLIVFITALHDLGKFASAFQALVEASHPQLVIVRPRRPYNSTDASHDRLGYAFWRRLQDLFLLHICDASELDQREKRNALTALTVLMECSLGHHGQPINTREWQILERRYIEPKNIEAATEFFTDLARLVPLNISVDFLANKETIRRLKQISWHIAGIVVVADWLGSNRDYFEYQPPKMSLGEYWSDAIPAASRALKNTELSSVPVVNPFGSVEEHFGFTPTPLQAWTQTTPVDDSPQLFILEDITGAGKTEAALVLTHRLLQAGAADGFYFGLPTMATSNAMFSRVADYYLKMLLQADGTAPSIVLAHGGRDMHPAFRDIHMAVSYEDHHYSRGDDTVSIQCNHWLADSRKKALLAPVGVGTIDQALLAVLPRKHQSLRLLGLSRKVLIFDEVHAADAYMFELLESVLTLHLHQGGSVILLTATLPQQQRERLINIWLRAIRSEPYIVRSSHFPLVSAVNVSAEQPVTELPLEVRPGAERRVDVQFLHSFEHCLDRVLNAASAGQSVVWIRNTVGDAIHAYQCLRERLSEPSQLLLFHSRFVLNDRQRIEARVLEWLGKHSDASQRSGRIIVATQVFQESLDADADVMVSDLCPIDDLIQRAGRLHRHTRDAQGRYIEGTVDARGTPVLWVHAPKWTDTPSSNWLQAEFAGTQAVYRSPGRLWLGMRKLQEFGGLNLPEQARELIEAVYGPHVYEQIPESLLQFEHQVMGEEGSKRAAGRSNVLDWQYGYSLAGRQNWTEDQYDISTRFSDVEVVNVVLLRETEKGLEPWVHDDRFSWQLSTVRLPRHTYADQMSALPDTLQIVWEHLCQRYRHLKFLQPWLVEHDDEFSYDDVVGVHKKNPR